MYAHVVTTDGCGYIFRDPETWPAVRCMNVWVSVCGELKIQIQQRVFPQPWIQSKLSPSRPSIKHNGGIIIAPLSSFLSSSSSVVSVYLSSHLSGPLLGWYPPLFTFNFSLWILIACCVFPGSVLIRIMISASDSAAAASKPPGVFLSWALYCCQWVVSILLTLLFENKIDLAFQRWTELIWSYLHCIILLGVSILVYGIIVYLSQNVIFSSFHLYKLCLHFFSLSLQDLEVIPGPQGTTVFSPSSRHPPSYPPSCPLYLCISPLFHTLPILAPPHSFNLETIASPTPQRATLSTTKCPDW